MQRKLSNHQIITILMQAFGYPSNQHGVCHGYTMMALQACHTGNIDAFRKRLLILKLLTSEEAIKNYAHTINGILENPNFIDATLKDDNASQQDKEKNILLLDQVIAMKIFLEGIEFCQNIQNYQEIVMHNLIQCHINYYFNIVCSKALESMGGFKAFHFELRLLNVEEQTQYFAFYENLALKNTCKFSIKISNHHHTIALHYEPETKNWILINANSDDLDVRTIKQDLAEWVRNSLVGESENILFRTDIIITANNIDQSMALTRAFYDFEMAVIYKNMCHPDRIFMANKAGFTPFSLAIQHENDHYFKLLDTLRKHAGSGLKESLVDFYYRLLSAIAKLCIDESTKTNCISVLKKSGVDYTICDANQMTLAHLAARESNTPLLLLLSDLGVGLTNEADLSKHRENALATEPSRFLTLAPTTFNSNNKRTSRPSDIADTSQRKNRCIGIGIDTP